MKKTDLLKIIAMRLNNKKSLRMIIAMAFGLIMVIQVVWLIFAFNISLQSQINSAPISNLLLVESNFYDDIKIDGSLSDTYYQGAKGRQLTSADKAALAIKEEIAWTEMLFNVNGRLGENINLTINDRRVDIKSELKFKFINQAEKGTCPGSINDFLIDTYDKGAIYGDNFSSDKKELYISELLLEKMGYSKEMALNSSISLNINYENLNGKNQRFLLDNDNIFDNQHIKMDDKDSIIPNINGIVQIFKNYKIVGVVNKEYYEINNFTKSEADIWLKDDSLITTGGQSLFPRISIQDLYIDSSKEDKIVLTYPNTDYVKYSDEVTSEGCFFPFFIGNSYISENRGANNELFPLKISYVQCDSFSQAKTLVGKIDGIINNKAGGNYYSVGSNQFAMLRQINTTTNTICLILTIVGGVSLITVLINYGNILCFNARKREPFLEMMRKIGITKKEKSQLITLEIFGGFSLASMIAFAIGILISAMIKLIFTTFFSAVFSKISIALWTFFPAYFAVIAVIGLVVAMISISSSIHNQKR